MTMISAIPQQAKARPVKMQANQARQCLSFAGEKEAKNDELNISTEKKPPVISTGRAIFSRLTDDQIKGVNESGRLPNNVKLVQDGRGNFTISSDIFGITAGTKKLPETHELRKTRPFGFTTVVPKETEGLFIKKSNA